MKRIAIILAGVALAGAVHGGVGSTGAEGGAGPRAPFPRHIAVGTNPADIAFDQRTRRAFVVNMGSTIPSPGTVTVLDADTGVVLRTAPAGLSPYAATVAPGAGRVFVSNENLPPAGGTIGMLDARSGATLQTIPAGPVPFALPDERAGRVFVLDEGGGLAMRAISTGAMLGQTSVPGVSVSWAALAVDRQDGRLFVVSRRPSVVREFDGRTLRLLRTLPVSPARADAQDVLVDPDIDRLIVVSRATQGSAMSYSSSAVTTVALRSGRLIGVTQFSGLIGTVQEDQRTAHLFVTSQEQSAASGKVSMLDAHTGVVLRTIAAPWGIGSIVVDGGRGRAFLSNGNESITMLSSASGASLRTIPLKGLLTLRVDDATGRLFAANAYTGVVTVFGPAY